jgi:formylglycine-generating enzyme required for sulfatase activity
VVKKLALVSIATSVLVSVACSQIVGITDTEVTTGSGGLDSSAGTSPGASGKNATTAGQSNNGGVANAGGDNTPQAGTVSGGGISTGGTSAGGSISTGGTSTGGTSTGGTSTGGKGGSGGLGGGGGDASVLHGPHLVQTTASFSVDATEVTVGDYKQFLKAKGTNTSGQPAVCSWNKSFYEAAAAPLEKDTWPIANVDWCDATAFCAWAGKRLCGAIGSGAVDAADALDPDKSQWLRACGGPFGQPHPNSSPDCNNKGGFEDVAAVASFPGCEGFDAGVFDMAGNVAEWVDSCDGNTGKADHCLALGGTELDQTAYCTESDDTSTRDVKSRYYGFRCCSK